MNFKKLGTMMLGIILVFSLAGCSTASKEEEKKSSQSSDVNNDSSTTQYPITINHTFGETVIESKPERVVTISWGNQDVPLALGVIPAGMSKANYGVTDGSGLLPWTADKLMELGEKNPNLFNDTAGLDYEAISDAKPDIILAAYSGITQEEYNLLCEIAPVVAYPTLAYQTFWRDQIKMDAAGMGMKQEGEQLVLDLEKLITEKTSNYAKIEGNTAAFFYFDPTDLGKFYIYLPADPRAAYLTDLGLKFPESVLNLSATNKSFSVELSAENVDILKDVDIIVAYGNDDLLKVLQADALVGTIPAIKRGSVALIENNTPLAASGTPSALSIPATIDDYLKILGEAADKIE